MISPTGAQAVDPEGEVAVARAAAARGTPMGLSSIARKPLEEVIAANPQTFFQSYWVGTREDMAARMERAKKAGADDEADGPSGPGAIRPLPHLVARTGPIQLKEGLRIGGYHVLDGLAGKRTQAHHRAAGCGCPGHREIAVRMD